MADHLLIGILIGVVCGIAALLVISIVTLRRIDLEWRDGERAPAPRRSSPCRRPSSAPSEACANESRSTRHELELASRDARDEASSSAGALRDEIAGGLRGRERRPRPAPHQPSPTSAVHALRDHPMPALTKLAQAQEQRLGLLTAELQSLAGSGRCRGWTTWALLGERLRQMQADHRTVWSSSGRRRSATPRTCATRWWSR